MPGKHTRTLVSGDKLEVEGVIQPLCDEHGRNGIQVEDSGALDEHGEPISIAVGSDYANSCSTVYDWLDETLSHTYLWDTEVTVRITVEVLSVQRKPTRWR